MKNLMFALIAMIGLGATAQSTMVNGMEISDAETVEIIITKRILSNKVNVMVDAGQNTKFFGSFFSPRKNHYVTEGDHTNNRAEFKSTVDALAFFETMGFEHHGVNGYGRKFFGRSNTGLLNILGVRTTQRGQRLILHKMKM